MVSLTARHEPVGALGPAPWLSAPATRAVVDALTAGGTVVRFVGGCVRDTLARRPVTDIDLATPDRPEVVGRLAADAGLKAVPTGIDHGTMTLIAEGQPFEVTTLREDTETDGRHAKVRFSDNWSADAARRDFTINGLSATPSGQVYDYFHGIPDLAYGRIRFIGRPATRIEEDYLRILRYFRFFAHYGRGSADRDALNACHGLRHGVQTLSAERVRSEFLRLLGADDPTQALVFMNRAEILNLVLAGSPVNAETIEQLRRLIWLETRALRLDGIDGDPLRRLAMFLPDAKAARATAVRFRLSNRDTHRLLAMRTADGMPDPNMPPAAWRKRLYDTGAKAAVDRCLIEWAVERHRTPRPAAARTAAWRGLVEVAASWRQPRLPVKGRDVVALGVSPGPRVGVILDRVKAWWQAGNFRADRDACMAELQRLVTKNS